ncbi:telomerase reverse transcriptase [Bombina bombina]|uniref:telomerase reverse transcriptase n=1 Tax=Bombina bombina TaxID=8345 RepID=UPI00235B2322|nr:telomerase reverse transcriptase [Bombina bombina]
MQAGENYTELLSIFQLLYDQVLCILDFLERLQKNTKSTLLQENESEKYKAFLSEVLVCIPRGAKPLNAPISFLQFFFPFFPQLSSQREVVARVIQRICEKKRRNVLAFGYGLVDEKSSLRVMFAPNICSYFPNPSTATISSSTLWKTLLSRIGDEVMMHMLEHCSLFMMVPPNCCYQISGQPVYNLYNELNLPHSLVRQRHSMTQSNALFQYIQKKSFLSKRSRRWKRKKLSKKKLESKKLQVALMTINSSTNMDFCGENASSESTSSVRPAKRLNTTATCDVPSKKKKTVSDVEGTRGKFSYRHNIDVSQISSVTSLEGKVQECPSDFKTKDFEGDSCYTSNITDTLFKCTSSNSPVTHKINKNENLNSFPNKISFSNIFIGSSKRLYSSSFSKEGFLKSFLLNVLGKKSNGYQDLLKTIFLNNSALGQNTDQQYFGESMKKKKKKKIPKRYWQMRHVFQKIIENHKRCPYSFLIQKHCRVRYLKSNSNKLKVLDTDKSQLTEFSCESENRNCPSLPLRTDFEAQKRISGIEKEEEMLKDESTILKLLRQHNSTWQVYTFVRECLHRVVPELLWGSSHNKCRFLKNVKSFIYSGKFHKISLQELMWKMRVEDCVWVRLLKRNHFVPASEHLLREEILGKFIYWLMDTYVIQLLKSFFYITETTFQKNRLFFYRKSVWKKIHKIGLRKHFEKVKLRLMSSKEIENVKQQKNVSLVSRLRFIPKMNGLRPISKMCDTLGVQQSKEIRDKKILQFNSLVKNLFSVLNYECSKNLSLLGSSVFGLNDIYNKWKKFVVELEESNIERSTFYFVKTDVRGAYDTIPHSKLDEVVSKVINPNTEEVYSIRRYATLWMDASGRIRKVFKQHVSTLVDFLPSMKQFVSHLQNHDLMQNCILVEQSLSLNESSSKFLAFFQQIICNHILRIKDDYYMQCCGIPQGSMLSTLFCSLCYGDMENKLFCGIQQDGIFMRLVDDFLLVTPHLDKAKTFLRTLAEGIPQYGCSISPHKTVVNFPVDDIPQCTKVEQLTHHCMFPWCGLLFDTHTLEVFCDYSSYACTSIRSSLTFCQSATAGKIMREKLIRVLKLKCHSIFLDLKVNSLRTVCINIYKIFLLQAYRFHACVLQLPFNQSVKNNPSYFLTVISDMAPCCYATLKGRNKGVILGTKNAGGPFPFEAAQWLCYHAFITKLAKHKRLYKCLLGPIKKCKQHLCRGLPQDTRQLLNGVIDPSLHKDFSTIMD